MTCNYSSFVLLATASCTVPDHTVPDRFGGWSLINNPICTLLCLPSPQSTHHPCPVSAEGLLRSGQDQRSVQSPQGGEGALGVAHGQQAPHSHATEALGCPGRLQATGRRGQECHVPCRERAVPPPRAAPAGCPMAAPRALCQGKKPATPKSLLTWQTAVVIIRKSLGLSTTASHFWF